MNITITFNDLNDITDGVEQLGRLVRGYADLLGASTTAESLQYLTEAHPAEENSAPQAETPDAPAETSRTVPQKEKAEPKPVAEKAAERPAEAPQEVPAAAPAIDESYRTEVRKVLTRLNKKVSGNPAAQLIQEVSGKRRLTDVPPELLPDLMKKAQEALKDAD